MVAAAEYRPPLLLQELLGLLKPPAQPSGLAALRRIIMMCRIRGVGGVAEEVWHGTDHGANMG